MDTSPEQAAGKQLSLNSDAVDREAGILTAEDRPTDTRGRIPVDQTGWRDGETHGTFDRYLSPDILLAMFPARDF